MWRVELATTPFKKWKVVIILGAEKLVIAFGDHKMVIEFGAKHFLIASDNIYCLWCTN